MIIKGINNFKEGIKIDLANKLIKSVFVYLIVFVLFSQVIYAAFSCNPEEFRISLVDHLIKNEGSSHEEAERLAQFVILESISTRILVDKIISIFKKEDSSLKDRFEDVLAVIDASQDVDEKTKDFFRNFIQKQALKTGVALEREISSEQALEVQTITDATEKSLDEKLDHYKINVFADRIYNEDIELEQEVLKSADGLGITYDSIPTAFEGKTYNYYYATKTKPTDALSVENSLSQIAERLRSSKKPVLITIDGRPGTGKTWFAKQLKGKIYTEFKPEVISRDKTENKAILESEIRDALRRNNVVIVEGIYTGELSSAGIGAVIKIKIEGPPEIISKNIITRGRATDARLLLTKSQFDNLLFSRTLDKLPADIIIWNDRELPKEEQVLSPRQIEQIEIPSELVVYLDEIFKGRNSAVFEGKEIIRRDIETQIRSAIDKRNAAYLTRAAGLRDKLTQIFATPKKLVEVKPLTAEKEKVSPAMKLNRLWDSQVGKIPGLIAQHEKLYQKGQNVIKFHDKYIIVQQEYGPTIIVDPRLEISTDQYSAYQKWKELYGYQPRSVEETKKAYDTLKQLLDEKNIALTIGYLMSEEEINKELEQGKLNEFADLFKDIATIIKQLPSSLFHNGDVKKIMLFGARSGAARLSSYDKGTVNMFDYIMHTSKRQFISTFVHELGHGLADHYKFLKQNPELRQKLDAARRITEKAPYVSDALPGTELGRVDYVYSSLNEFLAENFMHYTLQGEELRQHIASINDPAVKIAWQTVYGFYRNLFEGKEFGKISSKAEELGSEVGRMLGISDYEELSPEEIQIAEQAKEQGCT